MDAQLIKDLITAIQENTAKSSELITLMKREQQPWIGPDEAASLLGFPHTTSGSHRRRVIDAMKRHRPKGVRFGRPNTYYRAAVMDLAKEKALGRVHY